MHICLKFKKSRICVTAVSIFVVFLILKLVLWILDNENIETKTPHTTDVISHQKITISYTGDTVIENIYNDVLIVNSTINIWKIIEWVDSDLFMKKLKSLHGTHGQKMAQIRSMRQKSEITDLENQALKLTLDAIRLDDMRLRIEIDRMKTQKNYEIAEGLEKIVELRNSWEYDQISRLAARVLKNSEGKSATMFEAALSFEMVYDWVTALKYFEKSVIYARIEKESTGKYPEIFKESLYRYGSLLFLVWEFKKALPIFSELTSLESWESQDSAFKKSRAYVLAWRNLLELESYSEANDMFKKAEKALNPVVSSYPIEIAMIYKFQGDTLSKLRKNPEAFERYRLSGKALSLATPLNDLQKVQVFSISWKVAASLGDWKSAAAKYSEARHLAESTHWKKSIEYVEILCDVAELSFVKGEYHESEKLYSEAMISFRHALSIDSPLSFRILKWTIWSLLKIGKSKQAEKLFSEADNLAMRFYWSQSREYAEFKREYSMIGRNASP